jgi:hypothetical protein
VGGGQRLSPTILGNSAGRGLPGVALREALGGPALPFGPVGTVDSLAPHVSLIPAGHVTRCAGSCPNGLQAFGRFHCGCP